MLKDPTTSPENRLTTLRALSEQWGPDVKYAFFTIIETPGENPAIVKEIASVLRNKPTDENYKALVRALLISTDLNLQTHITKILKLRNPKGPTISDEDNEKQIKAKQAEWSLWMKSLK